jgi:hypothetical protein
VMEHAEFNGATGIGIGDEGQGQKCEFMCICLRCEHKFCDLTRLQLCYGSRSSGIEFSASDYPRNHVEAKDSSKDRRSGGCPDDLGSRTRRVYAEI